MLVRLRHEAIDFPLATVDGPAWELSLSWDGFTTQQGVGLKQGP